MNGVSKHLQPFEELCNRCFAFTPLGPAELRCVEPRTKEEKQGLLFQSHRGVIAFYRDQL